MLPTHRQPVPRARQSTRSVFALLAALWALPESTAHAHEFWIEPQSFRPAVGAAVPLKLHVGQDFRGDSVIYLPELFERYAVVSPEGEKPVSGIPGDDPAGQFKPQRPGLHVVVYRGTVASTRFDTREEFEQYLDKEGLERVRALPAYKAAGGRPPIRENYSRAAKALVAAGGVTHGALDRAFGLRLELVAERDPYALAAGGELPVRLLFEGRPFEGALIIAFNKAEPDKKLRVRTGKDGRALLKLTRAGTWLAASVHMFPASPGSTAHWESIWASLTFEMRP